MLHPDSIGSQRGRREVLQIVGDDHFNTPTYRRSQYVAIIRIGQGGVKGSNPRSRLIQRFLSLRIFGSLVGHHMLESYSPTRSDVAVRNDSSFEQRDEIGPGDAEQIRSFLVW